MFLCIAPPLSPTEIFSLGRSESNASLVLRLRGGGSEEDSSPEKFSEKFPSHVEDPVDHADFQLKNVQDRGFLRSAKVVFPEVFSQNAQKKEVFFSAEEFSHQFFLEKAPDFQTKKMYKTWRLHEALNLFS